MRLRLRAFALLALLAVATPAFAQMKIGHNLGPGLTYWDGGQAFSDLTRQASIPTGKAPLRPDGWPTYVDSTTGQCQVLMGTSMPTPAGTYAFTARGKGRVRISLSLGIWNTIDLTGPRVDLALDAPTSKPIGRNINLQIDSSDKDDPVRDVHVYMPDAVRRHPFSPAFLDDLRGAACVRTMDWQLTNTKLNDIVTWADYKATEATFYHDGQGVPLADCAALANELNCDLWVCIPLNADDDCIKQMALYLDARLKPGLRLFAELSNEIWNQSFRQGIQFGKESTAAKKNFWAYGGEVAGRKITAFRDHLVKAKSKRVVVRMMAGQALFMGGGQTAVDAAATTGGFDAISCAPYFSAAKDAVEALAKQYNEGDDAAKELAVAAMFDLLHADITKIGPFLRDWKTLADKHKVPLWAYEGGQHLIAYPQGAASNPLSRTPLFSAVNRDARMKVAYTRYLVDLERAGFAGLVHFNSHAQMSQYGHWGLREYVGQPLEECPKAQAVLEFMQQRGQLAR